jgi:hypothetical protein
MCRADKGFALLCMHSVRLSDRNSNSLLGNVRKEPCSNQLLAPDWVPLLVKQLL